MPRPHLSADEFRHLAERITNECTGLLEAADSAYVMPPTTGNLTAEALAEPFPEDGMGATAFDAIATLLAHSRPPSPRFFAYVFGSGEPVAALGDYLASVLNQNATAWRSAPAAITI